MKVIFGDREQIDRVKKEQQEKEFIDGLVKLLEGSHLLTNEEIACSITLAIEEHFKDDDVNNVYELIDRLKLQKGGNA